MKRKTILGIIVVLTVIALAVGCHCQSIPEEKSQIEETTETTQETTTKETTTEETEPPIVVEEEVVKVNAPVEIEGWTFKPPATYIDNTTGKVVAIFVENVLKSGDNWKGAIGIVPWELRNILKENAEKGIFKCPWPFDFTKTRGIETVELVSKQWLSGYSFPNPIGIKYSEPINFYAPFDVDEFNTMWEVWENIPDKEGDPDFYSAQAWKSIDLFTEFGYKSEEMDREQSAKFQCVFVDWKPSIELGEPRKVENFFYEQDIIEEIKCGDLLGELLPNTPDFDFLDFAKDEKFYENLGKFQAVLIISDFSNDLPNASCLERVLRLGEENQEITVFVWPGGGGKTHNS